jgi:hypothetical protein
MEIWHYTPRIEWKKPAIYERLAAKAAAAGGITLIATPYNNPPPVMIRAEVSAARAGASIVEIQAQTFDRNPSAYSAFVHRAVAEIRRANPNVMILAGLATDAGGVPTTAQNMYAEYQSVKGIVNGFWLNANTWGANSVGCAPQGCPTIATTFLHMVGA